MSQASQAETKAIISELKLILQEALAIFDNGRERPQQRDIIRSN